MKLLAINTASETVTIALIVNNMIVKTVEWDNDRSLSKILLSRITELFEEAKIDIEAIDGVIVLSGPGSFTSLRIGVTVANTIAQTVSVKIVGIKDDTDNWIEQGMERFKQQKDLHASVFPHYGRDPHITKQKK